MIAVKEGFQRRCAEISKYQKILSRIIEEDAILYSPSKQSHKKLYFDSESQKLLKANLILMLYNLMESTVSSALSELYDHVSSRGLKYGDVADSIRKIWISLEYKNFRNMGINDLYGILASLSANEISIQFDRKRQISGNIDARKIRDFADQLGITLRVHHSLNAGDKLVRVKQLRNELAHGEKSFSEGGREFSYPEIIVVSNQVIKYLESFIRSVEKYLVTKSFIA